MQSVKQTLVGELSLIGRLVEDLTTLARVGDQVLLKIKSLPLQEFVGSIVTMAEPILGDRLQVDYAVGGATLRAVYVGYLRRKLGEPAIETVRGMGYRLRYGGGPASHA